MKDVLFNYAGLFTGRDGCRCEAQGMAAVVLHRKSPGAKQMRPDRLACKVKNAGIKMKRLYVRNGKCCAGDRTCYQIDRKENRW